MHINKYKIYIYIFKLFSFQGDIKSFDNINSCLENYIINKYDDLNDTAEKKNLQTIVKNLYNKLNKKLDIYKKTYTLINGSIYVSPKGIYI